MKREIFIWKNASNAQLKQRNFKYSFRPIYYFLYCAGLWPFSIIHHSNGRIHRACISFYDILWSILVIGLNLTFAYFAYEKLMTGQGIHENRTQFFLFNIFKMRSVLFGGVGVALDMFNCNKLVDIL